MNKLLVATIHLLCNPQVPALMEMLVMSRETIKPSSPTPLHLKHRKLSLIDQFLPTTLYTRLILFYSAQGDVHRFENSNMSHRFKKSLSEVLTDFYPLAGKLDQLSHSIKCNDDGLEYTEARVKAPLTLSQLLASPNPEELDRLQPHDAYNYGSTGWFKGLSAVQVTVFEQCGGMAIGFSLNHILADAASLVFFINAWVAAVARGEDKKSVAVVFTSESLFPPRVMSVQRSYDDIKGAGKLVVKRFVFSQSKIDTLKAKFEYPHPTRVEVVSALLFKCMIRAFMSTSPNPIVSAVVINLRSRMTPPLPAHYFGNMVLTLTTERVGPECLPKSLNDTGMELRSLIKKFDSDYVEKLQADNASLLFEFMGRMPQLESRFIGVTSWCRFPIYEADFGWGVPIWTASVHPTWENCIVISDAKNGDGIEAWATLPKEEMALFESDTQLLEFAYSNPTVSEF